MKLRWFFLRLWLMIVGNWHINVLSKFGSILKYCSIFVMSNSYVAFRACGVDGQRP
jgi:hypothetical protein